MLTALELSSWEKFSILSWKNVYVGIKDFKQILYITLIPPLFGTILVLVRFFIEVKYMSAKSYRPMDVNRTWYPLLLEIEERRSKIRLTRPEFDHSTYVPQLILAFAPKDQFTLNLLKQSINTFGITYMGSKIFSNCDELKAKMAIEHYFAGVCIDYNFKISRNIEMKMIFPSELRMYKDSYIGANWNTNNLYDLYTPYAKRYFGTTDGGYVGYMREGFAHIQNAVSMAFIYNEMPANYTLPKIQRFPALASFDDTLTGGIKASISLIFVCGFLYPVLMLTNSIVKEKKKQIKKMMKVMGVQNWIQIAAWFLKFFILMYLSAIVIVIILKVHWKEDRAILSNSSVSVLLLILFAYVASAASFSIMMSSFFTDSKMAVPLTGLIWICSYLPFVASSINPQALMYLRPLMCCFCNTVLGLIFNLLIEIEKFDLGFEMATLTSFESGDRIFTPAIYIVILFVLTFAHIAIALHVDEMEFNFNVFSKQVTLLFRSRESAPRVSRRLNVHMRDTLAYEIEHEYKNIMIKIENLSKVFKGKYAVKNVNMNLYEGDITVLMGHNGSGKTVLLQMIAGLITPTSGKIEIQKMDAKKYKNLARRNLGICLHEGLLFPELNVVDQLIFFARLRGLNFSEVEAEVKKYLNVMHLNHRKYAPTNVLSKGEQRFLSVCCALIGRCKIILLDEPSLGLDLVAKESLWELLRVESKTRSILLTTHSEKEAESLADQIAIFWNGELKCYGSTFFLKKVYGQGHRLTCFKGNNFVRENLTNLIQSHIPNAQIESEIGHNISYIFADVKGFSELFDELESKADTLGITGITVAELDSADIFLRIAQQNATDGIRQRHSDMVNDDSIYKRESIVPNLEGSRKSTGCHLFINQCQVMLVKRFLSSLRNMLLSLLQLTMPILFTIVSFSLLTYQNGRVPLPDITYELQSYPDSVSLVHITPWALLSESNKAIFDAYMEALFWTGPNHRTERIPTGIENLNRFLQSSESNINFKTNRHLIGVSIQDKSSIAFFNNYPLHTLPLSLNMLHNAILRAVSTNASIKLVLSPLPFASKHNINAKSLPVSIGNYLAVNISFCVGFTWSLSIIFLVRERRKNFKFFQYFFGVRGYVFWLNTFIFDIMIIVMTTLIILLTIVFFEVELFMKESTSGSYFLILIIAGTCMCSANYLVSVVFNDPIIAFIVITVFNSMGTMSYWAYLEIFTRGFHLNPNSYIYRNIMLVLPHFALCAALVKTYNFAELSILCKDEETKHIYRDLKDCSAEPKCCRDYEIWSSWDGVWSDLIYIFFFGIICWIILYIMENYKIWFGKVGVGVSSDESNIDFYSHFKDSDSDSPEMQSPIETYNDHSGLEKQEVLDIDPIIDKERVLVCKLVSSEVNNHLLIDQITFAVNRGECLTILGKNASGKSAIIKTLIGCAPLSFGKVHIDGLSLRNNLYDIYQRIGYCSQDEIFLPEYKLFELMEMACILRGIPNREVVDICEYLAKIMGFYGYLQKRYEACSAGIRKRLYVACALIGKPQLVFLDSAQTSLDIVGRRQLFNVICTLRSEGQSVILTSTTIHYCDCIIDRMLLLSKGRQILLKDPWSVCQNYVRGYILKVKVRKITIKLPTSTESLLTPRYHEVSANTFLKLATFIESEFPLYQVKDKLGSTIEYFIPIENSSISNIFKLMQRNAFTLYVEDFSITTLTLSMFFMEEMKQQRFSS